MSPSTLRRLDQLSVLLLLLWAGAALGFGIFSAPVLFRELSSRDVAGRIAGMIISRLDWAAWAAFGLASLSWGGRWVAEVKDDLVGPIRLWSAALTVALLMCLAPSNLLTLALNPPSLHLPGTQQPPHPDPKPRKPTPAWHPATSSPWP